MNPQFDVYSSNVSPNSRISQPHGFGNMLHRVAGGGHLPHQLVLLGSQLRQVLKLLMLLRRAKSPDFKQATGNLSIQR